MSGTHNAPVKVPANLPADFRIVFGTRPAVLGAESAVRRYGGEVAQSVAPGTSDLPQTTAQKLEGIASITNSEHYGQSIGGVEARITLSALARLAEDDPHGTAATVAVQLQRIPPDAHQIELI